MEDGGEDVLSGLGIIEQASQQQLFPLHSSSIAFNGASAARSDDARHDQQQDHKPEAGDQAADQVGVCEAGIGNRLWRRHSLSVGVLAPAEELHDVFRGRGP
jgi:hypothetical protein